MLSKLGKYLLRLSITTVISKSGCFSNRIILVSDAFNEWTTQGNRELSVESNSLSSTYHVPLSTQSRTQSVSRSSVAGPPFLCTTCGKSYLQYPSLWRHLRYECQKMPLFQCPYCSYCCKQKGYMKKHVERRHGRHLVTEPRCNIGQVQ